MKAAPDLSEFYAQRADRRTCAIADALATLDPDESAKLAAALATPEIRHSEIQRWLSSRNVKVASSTIGRHRSRECVCG